jgi:hypothetical protein
MARANREGAHFHIGTRVKVGHRWLLSRIRCTSPACHTRPGQVVGKSRSVR